MPLIAYSCSSGHKSKKFFRESKTSPATLVCDKCGEEMNRLLSSPSSLSKIVIDNGIQSRAVEVDPNIVEINEERSQKDYRDEP